jgi:hypothetical protein
MGGGERALNNKFSKKFTVESMLSDEDDEDAFAELERCLPIPNVLLPVYSKYSSF